MLGFHHPHSRQTQDVSSSPIFVPFFSTSSVKASCGHEFQYARSFLHIGICIEGIVLLLVPIPHSHHPGGFSMDFSEHSHQTFVVCDPHVLYQQGMLHASWHWRATLNSRQEGRYWLQTQMLYYSPDSFSCIRDMWFIVIGNFYSFKIQIWLKACTLPTLSVSSTYLHCRTISNLKKMD